MSESVNIIIDADDLASAKVAAAAKNVENNIKAIKEGGENAKKSTEFFGVIANSLGGSELGAYASQLAGITEKTSQFAEVQKLGGAGAMAFKAGLVGVVAVLAFQVGQALGNAIFETERWNDELAKGRERAKELSTELLKLQGIRIGDQREDNSLIADPEARLEAQKVLRDTLQKELNGTIEQKKKLLDELESIKKIQESGSALNPSSLGLGAALASANKARKAELESSLDGSTKSIESLKEELRVQEDLISNRTLSNEALKERNALAAKNDSAVESLRTEIALLQGKQTFLSQNHEMLTRERDLLKETKANEAKSESYLESLRNEVALLKAKGDELFKIEAGQKTFGAADNAEAAALLKERDMLKQKQDAEKQAAAQKEQEAKRIADLKQTELDKLAEEQVLLTKGKEAAHAFALEKQGLSKADAANIAAQQAQNDALKAKQTAKPNAPTQQINQAFEARLLTRGPAQGDPQAVIAQNTAAMLAEQKLANKIAEKNREATRIKVLKAG